MNGKALSYCPWLTLPAMVCEALGIELHQVLDFFFSHYQAKFNMRMGRFKKLFTSWGGRELKYLSCQSLVNSGVAYKQNVCLTLPLTA